MHACRSHRQLQYVADSLLHGRIGTQCLVLVGAYYALPDYPAKNLLQNYVHYGQIVRRHRTTCDAGCVDQFRIQCVFHQFLGHLMLLLDGPP